MATRGFTRTVPAMQTLTLLTDDDVQWDAARSPWNLAADQRPEAVARPLDSAEVRDAVLSAADRGWSVAPQSTGHNAMAMGPLDGALLVNTGAMNHVDVDPDARVARVGPGALWADVVTAAAPHGLMPLSGSSPDVAVAGYLLGGGLSWLGRLWGLAAGTLRAADLVTADGELHRAGPDGDQELLWALRGGGGAFGVLTELVIDLLPVPELTAGAVFWPWEHASSVLRAWLRWTRTAPRTATTSARILRLPDLPAVPAPLRGRCWVTIDGALVERPSAAAELLAPLRALDPQIDSFAPAGPETLLRMHGDPEEPVPAYSGHALLRRPDDELIDALVDTAGPGSGSPLTGLELRHLGGRLAEPDDARGALSALDGEFLLYAYGVPVDDEAGAAVLERIAAVENLVSGAAEPLRFSSFTERPVPAADLWPAAALARLRAIKRRVDPDGRIRSNHPLDH
jgi:FAD/FMN-containing dehydrogenase